jgi:ABC-2 type transport system ATP-binding protein
VNAIEINNLKKHFPATPKTKPIRAVDGISFKVFKGEIFGFLGPNGAGKTTTIRCIMNFLHPTSGEIKILDKDSKKDSVFLKSKIGYLSGNVRLNLNWTGEEHLVYIESIRGKSSNARELAKKFDLDLSKKFKNLSSGNKQKLGLVISLMSEPEILIMDEPTVGLDPLLQTLIYEVLEELREKGTTILISSHNLSEVERLCDRVGIIKEGKMVAIEPVSKLGGKRLHRVEVRFADKYQSSDFKFNGVEKVEEIPGGVILTVSGDLNAVVKKIATHKITDLEITHASLEEIFLKFYKKGVNK